MDTTKFDHDCDELGGWVNIGPCSHNRIGWLWRLSDRRGCVWIRPEVTPDEADKYLQEEEGLDLEWYLNATIEGEPHVATLMAPQLSRALFQNVHCPRDTFLRNYVVSMVRNPFDTLAFTTGFNARMMERMFDFPSNHPELLAEHAE